MSSDEVGIAIVLALGLYVLLWVEGLHDGIRDLWGWLRRNKRPPAIKPCKVQEEWGGLFIGRRSCAKHGTYWDDSNERCPQDPLEIAYKAAVAPADTSHVVAWTPEEYETFGHADLDRWIATRDAELKGLEWDRLLPELRAIERQSDQLIQAGSITADRIYACGQAEPIRTEVVYDTLTMMDAVISTAPDGRVVKTNLADFTAFNEIKREHVLALTPEETP